MPLFVPLFVPLFTPVPQPHSALYFETKTSYSTLRKAQEKKWLEDKIAKIIFLSDTHGHYERIIVPVGDILVHSGDFGRHGTLAELKEFHSWFSSHPHKHKVFVAGNHDWCFERESEAAREVMQAVNYLQDEAATIMGLKFYGSPWQPWFFDWAFNLPRGKALADVWAKIPERTDVLVTHSPPYGILDKAKRGDYCGCQDLLERVKLIQPKLHLFGHIHEEYGMIQVESTTFANGSICDENNLPRNKPIEIECV